MVRPMRSRQCLLSLRRAESVDAQWPILQMVAERSLRAYVPRKINILHHLGSKEMRDHSTCCLLMATNSIETLSLTTPKFGFPNKLLPFALSVGLQRCNTTLPRSKIQAILLTTLVTAQPPPLQGPCRPHQLLRRKISQLSQAPGMKRVTKVTLPL